MLKTLPTTNNKSLIYDTLKTLSIREESSQYDFFQDDDYEEEDVYVPESFSSFFGDIISEEELQQVIEQLQIEQELKLQLEKKGNHLKQGKYDVININNYDGDDDDSINGDDDSSINGDDDDDFSINVDDNVDFSINSDDDADNKSIQ
jgi:hypothetical protein